MLCWILNESNPFYQPTDKEFTLFQLCVTVYPLLLFGDLIWGKSMRSSENLKFLDNMVMTTKTLMPYNRPHAFYSLAAHITSITTFHSSRPGFPPVSLFLPSLSFSPSHLPSFLTLPLQSVLFPNQSNEMDLHWGDFIPGEEGAAITASCQGDDDWNEKQEVEVSKDTNQRGPAVWLTFKFQLDL